MGTGKQKKGLSLATKIGLAIIVLSVLICVTVIIVGSMTFSDRIKEQYNNTAYQITHVVEDYFEPGELASYADTAYRYSKGEISEEEAAAVVSSPRYQEIYALIVSLRDNTGANDIFVSTPDYDSDKPILYIMDSYVIEEQCFTLGDASPMNGKYLEITKQAYESGTPVNDYLISKSEFGYNTSASYPVVEDGHSIAFINVEVPMVTIQSATLSFTLRTITTTVLITLLLLALDLFLVRKTLIDPLRLVAKEAGKFAQDNTRVSELLSEIRTGDEVEVLGKTIYQMEKDINDYIDNLTRVTAEKERIGAELNVATQIQADMLPRIFPPFPERKEFDLFASMDPAKEVGGDFYDFFLVDEDHIALVVADVSGKGVPAALFMVIAKTLIKNRTLLGGGGPAEILTDVNNQLCEGNEAELFVTVWLAVIQISTGKGLAANAGHEHPALKRKDGTFELIEYRHSPAVATMEGIRFREHEFELHPGDTLIEYTDGVTEATNAHDELFGNERLINALNLDPNAEPDTLLHTLREEIDRFVGDAPQFDDITMLGFHYKGKENEHE